MKLFATVFVSLLLVATPQMARAADIEVNIVIKDHRFDPAEVRAPAGQKLKLVVRNADATPEEFESKSLKREKIIQGGSTLAIPVGPLKPGRYTFFGEFHEDTAQGVLIVE